MSANIRNDIRHLQMTTLYLALPVRSQGYARSSNVYSYVCTYVSFFKKSNNVKKSLLTHQINDEYNKKYNKLAYVGATSYFRIPAGI